MMHKTFILKVLILMCGSFALFMGGYYARQETDIRRAPELMEQAATAEARGEYAVAFRLYQQAAKIDPGNAENWAALGEHLRFYAHNPKEATVAFQKALSVQPQSPLAAAFAWRGLGELAAEARQDEIAIGYFEKSLAAMPLADTHRSLCHLYCRQRSFNAAAEQARQAVQLNPEDPIAVLLYAAQLQRAGAKEEGGRQFSKALALAGIDANGVGAGHVHCCVFYNAAGYLAVQGDQTGALRMLQKFFETPNHRHLTREDIETDADFEALKETPAFNHLLDAHIPRKSTSM